MDGWFCNKQRRIRLRHNEGPGGEGEVQSIGRVGEGAV